MSGWVSNTPLFTSIFLFRKRSERKDKQSSDILLKQTQEYLEAAKRKKNGAGFDGIYMSK